LSQGFDEFGPRETTPVPLPHVGTAYAQPPLLVEPGAFPPPMPYRPEPLRWLQIGLFLLACVTTTQVGNLMFPEVGGLAYSIPLMFTLLCHELGHYIQSRRYQVLASWPFFIPMPLPPLGTMGAVIRMRGHIGNRRALFDIGISGPLAGLVPTMIFTIVGLSLSKIVPAQPIELGDSVGAPLLFRWLIGLILGPVPLGHAVDMHPVAYAGWVGMFITALNLIPIGQLDGGHILYALLRRKAHIVAQLFLGSAVLGVVITGNWGWTVMLMLLLFIGPNHPPTADDSVPLGTGRTILGWLTLCFIFIGFTPQPFN
jgi:membrane-associated protease RseP (regulator of RpoE activity)